MSSPFDSDLPLPKLTRRRLLKGSLHAATAAAASLLMPPNVQRALAKEPRRRFFERHQARRPADAGEPLLRPLLRHAGRRARLRRPERAETLDGRSVFHQPDAENPNGYLLPFHLDTRTTSAQKIPSTSHAWAVQHEAWNGGKMDNWLPAHRKADGEQRPVRDGLLHARRHSLPVRAGRGVHHLRRTTTAR